jgi:hypothetical protein
MPNIFSKRLLALTFCGVSLCVGAPCLAPEMTVFAQSEGISDGELAGVIRSYRSELAELQNQVAAYNQSKGRKRGGFDDVRKGFDGLNAKVNQCRQRVQFFYEQVVRLYRTSPNSQNYLQARQAYTDLKEMFDGISTNFSSVPRPESMQVVEVNLTDGRLNKHMAAVNSDDAPAAKPAGGPTTGTSLVDRLFDADEVRYIGKFDQAEVYLFIIKDKAHYAITGMREQANDANGKPVERVSSAVVCTDAFNWQQTSGFTPQQHFDNLLKLKMTTLPNDRRTSELVQTELVKARSYARSQ